MSGLLRVVLVVSTLALAACGGGGIAAPDPQTRGEKVFARHCSSCHSTSPDTVVVGPSLAGVGARAGERVDGMGARAYLETSIVEPGEYLVPGFRDLMPDGFGEDLAAEDLKALIDYLAALR